MNKHKLINILSAIIAGSGLIFQIYCDHYQEQSNNYGTWMVMLGLFMSVANDYIKNKAQKDSGE